MAGKKSHELKEEVGKKVERILEKDIPKAHEKVDEKVQELEGYIRKEPLKSVSAAFLLGLFIGRMMK